MKKIIVLLSLILFAQASYAQAVPALLIPSDSRSMAMGGVALQPAADRLDAQAFYGMWAPKTANNTVIGGNVFLRVGKKIGVSVEGRTFMDKPYDILSAQGLATGGSFRPSDLIAGAGVSYDITDGFTVGFKGRMVSSKIAEDAKGSAFCADLSATYATQLFSAGIAVRNVGSKISYGAGSYSLPALAALQGSIKPFKGLTVGAEADYLFAGAVMAALGVEYGIADIVFVRGGFHYGDNAKGIPTYASLGLGVQFAGVHLDAAYLTASKTLRNSLQISLGYAF